MTPFISSFLSYLFLLLGVLISVAFMILFERKVLGYIQLRKGPNKVGLSGILQSFSDAIKLFIKEQFFPSKLNFLMFLLSPILSLFVILMLWMVIPCFFNEVNIIYSGLFFFCCTSFGVYCLIGSGWSSNSNYSLIGAIRGVAQTISYEVSMALFFLSIIFLINCYSFTYFFISQMSIWFLYIFFPVFICWFVSMLAETNRTPFDFAEGESELVSGFNVEYGSGGFALLFLSEYASIIFMSFLVSLMFFSSSSIFIFLLLGTFFCFFFIWVRGCYPRYRYDKLMYLAWKTYLPCSLFIMSFYIILNIFIFNFF
uniref:NADH-ubiquinone oxidoreductase chain 1 n=1 Tax=Bourletiella arvalis TaxID=2049373 RepID=A0A3B1EF64_9HEXA|nr:NADH dehydrogenase subunit 1 [Bourletiella arvalis]ATP01411.1 NADH dehydrogenase subunit 1 [Bourletiella arvalis]